MLTAQLLEEDGQIGLVLLSAYPRIKQKSTISQQQSMNKRKTMKNIAEAIINAHEFKHP